MFQITYSDGSVVDFKDWQSIEKTEDIEKIYSPDEICLERFAFADCKKLKEVDFPNLIEVKDIAFFGCKSLEQAKLPKLTTIGFAAFQYCNSLTEVDFPEAREIIAYTFDGCVSLKTANLPKVTNIGVNAFQDCTKLTKVRFSPTLEVEPGAFHRCQDSLKISGMKAVGGGTYVRLYDPETAEMRSLAKQIEKKALDLFYSSLEESDKRNAPATDTLQKMADKVAGIVREHPIQLDASGNCNRIQGIVRKQVRLSNPDPQKLKAIATAMEITR